MKSFFSSLLGATLFVILLFFPGLVFEGAKMGLNLWFFTLVPTLLPFMVFSNILIQSRLINLFVSYSAALLHRSLPEYIWKEFAEYGKGLGIT